MPAALRVILGRAIERALASDLERVIERIGSEFHVHTIEFDDARTIAIELRTADLVDGERVVPDSRRFTVTIARA